MQPTDSSLSHRPLSSISEYEKCENVWQGSGYHLLHYFPDLTNVEFWLGQKVKYAKLVPCNPFNHRFLALAKVVFWDRQNAKMCAMGQPTTWNIAFSSSPKSHFS